MEPSQMPTQQTDQIGPIWPPAPTWPGEIVERDLPVTSSEIFWQIVGRMTKMGVMRGALLGALVGVFFWIVGAVFGLFIGGLAGLVLGFLDGLVLGAVTCGFYMPLANEKRYYAVICVLSCLTTSLGCAGMIWICVRPSFSEDDNSWLIWVIPAVIATVAATEAGFRLAKWYINEA